MRSTQFSSISGTLPNITKTEIKMGKNFISILAMAFLIVLSAITPLDCFKPVIIIPGTGGSQIEAKLDKPSVNHFYCSRTSDWYTLWLSVTQLIPPFINCWVDNIMLLWDPMTKTYSNNAGVSTRIPYSDGSTLNFEYMDPSIHYGDSDYFHTLVEAMVGAGGVRNVTIRGSPYDFRYSPSSAYAGNWFDKMTALVEETYELNNRTKVTILSHSMGCLYGLWFLNQKDDEWKSKYIFQWIPTAGVFGGAGSGIKQVLSGDVSIVPIPGLTGLMVREEQRSFESSMILLPTAQVWGNRPLIFTPNYNYSVNDYEVLFQRSNFEHGFERYQLVANQTANLNPPGVHTVHLYGTDMDTPTFFRYSSDSNFDEEPETINGNGDDTVPIASLQSAGLLWKDNNNGMAFFEKSFSGQTHTGILKNSEYTQDVLQLLS